MIWLNSSCSRYRATESAGDEESSAVTLIKMGYNLSSKTLETFHPVWYVPTLHILCCSRKGWWYHVVDTLDGEALVVVEVLLNQWCLCCLWIDTNISWRVWPFLQKFVNFFFAFWERSYKTSAVGIWNGLSCKANIFCVLEYRSYFCTPTNH